MPQYICLQSYLGSSTFTYDVFCDGRRLSIKEVRDMGLTNLGDIELHKLSDYLPAWHEISTGTLIKIIRGEVGEEVTEQYTVPSAGLPDPPTSLVDKRGGPNLHEYLAAHCACERLDDP